MQDSLLFRNTSFQQVAQSRGPSMPFFPPAHTAATFAALAPPDATSGAPQATTKGSSREAKGGSNISAVLAPTLLLHEPRALLLLASAPLQTLLYKDVLQHAEGKAAKRKQKVVQANVARDVGRKLLAESRSTVDKLHAQSYVGALSLAVQARQLANAHGDVADMLRGQLAGKQASGKQLSSKQVTLLTHSLCRGSEFVTHMVMSVHCVNASHFGTFILVPEAPELPGWLPQHRHRRF